MCLHLHNVISLPFFYPGPRAPLDMPVLLNTVLITSLSLTTHRYFFSSSNYNIAIIFFFFNMKNHEYEIQCVVCAKCMASMTHLIEYNVYLCVVCVWMRACVCVCVKRHNDMTHFLDKTALDPNFVSNVTELS